MSNAIFQPPPGLGWSVVKRPKYSTITLPTTSGRGQLRVALQLWPIWEYEFLWEYLLGGEQTGLSAQTAAQNGLEQLMGFYLARQGSYDSFLYRDPNDNAVSGMPFGTGDGSTTAFQLQRNIGSGVDIVQNVDSSVLPPTLYKYDFQGANNLCPNSDNFAAWSFDTGASSPNPVVTANAAMAPDGSNNAAKAVFYNLFGTPESMLQSDTQTVPLNGETWTFSVWMRADSPQTVNLRIVQATGQNDIVVPKSVSTQWARYLLTVTAGSVGTGNFLCRIGLCNSTVNMATVYLWGAQAEIGSGATAYQKTGAAQSVPWGPTRQFNFSRTNLLLYSQDFENAAWTKWNSCQVTADASTAPDGSSTADYVFSGGSGSTSFQQVAQNIQTSNGVYLWAASFWARANTATTLDAVIYDNTGVTYATITASIVSGPGSISVDGSQCAHITNLSTTRWTRISLVMTAPVASGHILSVNIYPVSQINTTANLGVYLWGAQAEIVDYYVGSTQGYQQYAPSSYISTTSAAVSVTDYTLGSTGIVTFATAPASGALLTWTGSYYYRLHFSDDSNDFEEFMYQIWTAKKIKCESVIV